MKNTHQLVSIGIDVAKDKFDAAFVYGDNLSDILTFENNKTGIKKFIREVKKQKTAEAVPCVLESTGLYHLSLAIAAVQAEIQVKVINPLITKKYQRSSVRNAKTDIIDALRLAEIGLKEQGLPLFTANIPAIEAKKLVSYIAKLEALKQQLCSSLESVKSMHDITGMKVSLLPTQKVIQKIDEQILVLSEKIKDLAPQEAKELASNIYGLSHEKLSIVMAMISDKEFTDRDQLIAFVGLDVMPRQSGVWQGKGRLSKRGNAYLRKVLYQIAWGLKQHNDTFKKKYNELRERGVNYVTALIILARKFLRFLYSWYWKNHACPQMSF